MNDIRYKWILYIIVAVIAATIGIQVYWNFKNYQTNKQQLINEVQISLDKAVDDYYAALAKKTTIGFSLTGDQQNDPFKEGSEIRHILGGIDEKNKVFTNLDSIKVEQLEGITVLRGHAVDSMNNADDAKKPPMSMEAFKAKIKDMKAKNDTLGASSIKMLTSKIVVSINNDTLDLKKVDSLLTTEFERKNITVDYNLAFKKATGNHIYSELNSGNIDSVKTKNSKLSTTSKSTFLPNGSTLKINFSNETKVILNRILGGILISTLLVLAVISCLFYLLKIIKHQKQLAEVKNDLISNITHEFKTPIATIGVALESISNFNAIEDKAKTKKYLTMSTEQLNKLTIMVEKLLETATLDSDNLELNKTPTDISALLSNLTNRFKIQFPKKVFETNFETKNLIAKVDVFHFENLLNNILDNAVKYGGPNITVQLISNIKSFQIKISDNGKTLTQANKDRIFEKFYRVPKGNTHDVKGFGIGLYYVKSIVEKHKGTVNLELKPTLTTFIITLPNG